MCVTRDQVAVGSLVGKLLPLLVTMLQYSEFNYSYINHSKILTISKRFAWASNFSRAAVQTFLILTLAEQSSSAFVSNEVNQMREIVDIIDPGSLRSCSWSGLDPCSAENLILQLCFTSVSDVNSKLFLHLSLPMAQVFLRSVCFFYCIPLMCSV